MERAWPFESRPEGGARPRSPADFVAERGEGTDAVIVRIGLHDAQLVLIDPAGAWERWVYRSMDEASEVAESLGVAVHEGEYPEAVRVRMNSYRRPAESFAASPYPEQGRVGPVLPYPENRPRPREPLPEELPPK
ncbi:MAG TPA: hypothetical protein VHJ82_04115 [Actinomycetota bacterium]|nr:hypothetical protein [Actinomycetota bacterium]